MLSLLFTSDHSQVLPSLNWPPKYLIEDFVFLPQMQLTSLYLSHLVMLKQDKRINTIIDYHVCVLHF